MCQCGPSVPIHPLSNLSKVLERGATHVREDDVVYIIRPQIALGQILNNIRSRLDRSSAFYMPLDWCWICTQVTAKTEVEEDVCSFAGAAVDVLDEEGERWDCSTGIQRRGFDKLVLGEGEVTA